MNDDGYVSPLDALLLINALNSFGARALTGVNLSATYCDVNGDKYVSPLDALCIINWLNQVDGAGEGESATDHEVRELALRVLLGDTAANSTSALDDVLDQLCAMPSSP